MIRKKAPNEVKESSSAQKLKCDLLKPRDPLYWSWEMGIPGRRDSLPLPAVQEQLGSISSQGDAGAPTKDSNRRSGSWNARWNPAAGCSSFRPRWGRVQTSRPALAPAPLSARCPRSRAGLCAAKEPGASYPELCAVLTAGPPPFFGSSRGKGLCGWLPRGQCWPSQFPRGCLPAFSPRVPGPQPWRRCLHSTPPTVFSWACPRARVQPSCSRPGIG